MKLRALASILPVLFSCVMFAQDVPKGDVFFGYSFLRYNSAQTVPAFTANGGLGTFALNFGNHLGLEAELGGYHNGNIKDKHFDTTTFSFLFGPRLSAGRSKRIDPYIHTLFGGQHATTSIASDSVLVVNPTVRQPSSDGRYKGSQTTFAMAAGGGLDIKLSRKITLRPIQLDYYLTRFEAPEVVVPTGSTVKTARNQNNLRYAAGIAFNFGGERAAPPPAPPRVTTKTCPDGSVVLIDRECPKRDISLGLNVDQSAVCAGTVVHISPAAQLPPGSTLEWSVNGESINQASPAFEFGTTGRNPGTYKIGMKVTAEGYNDASTETTVSILPYQPPSGTLQVSPAEIWAGEKATLTPNFSAGKCGGTLKPATFTASEGSVTGNEFDSSTVQFDPSSNSEQQKTITIAANVSDDKGSGSAEGRVVVKKKEVVTAKRLPDIVFPVGSARVNNCGKRVLLEELKASADNDSTAKVVFVGHQAESESKWPGLDQKRALNAAAIISAGQGICTSFPANQVLVSAMGTAQGGVDFQPRFCGTSAGPEKAGQGVDESDDAAKYRRVEVWFVRTGAALPASLKESNDAVSLSVSSLGCPR